MGMNFTKAHQFPHSHYQAWNINLWSMITYSSFRLLWLYETTQHFTWYTDMSMEKLDKNTEEKDWVTFDIAIESDFGKR